MTSLEHALVGDLNDDGLIMRLDFEKVSNSIITDISPYGLSNDGILKNGTKVSNTNTKLGSVANFDGNDDYIHINDSVDINLGNHSQRTIALWFKVDDKNISSRKQVIYEEGGKARGLNIYIFDGKLYVGGWNRPESNWKGTFLSTDQIQPNTWHHVTLVLDAEADTRSVQSGVFSAYLDGQKFGEGVGSQLWSHSDDIGLGKVNGATLFHDNTTSADKGFQGSIDDLRVYNRVLSTDEISILREVIPNQNPYIKNDEFHTDENSNLTFTVDELLNNDHDPDNDILSIVSVDTSGLKGSLTDNGNGTYTYATNSQFELLGIGEEDTDSFIYTISDGQGGTASAVVTMLIDGVNDVPIAVDDTSTTNEDQSLTLLASTLLGNDSDIDGDSLAITQVTNAVNGTVNLGTNNNIIFTPNANFNGNASFDYIINDGQGGTSIATVNIAVSAVNDNPIANDDLLTTNQNQSITFNYTDLLANDSDLDNDNLDIVLVNNAVNGSVTLDDQGNTIFTPNLSFSGDASFDYVVSDGHGGTATATVKVTVNPVLALPDLVTKYQPSSLPSLSTGSDVFAPSFVEDSGVSLTSVSLTSELTPQIAEWTRTGERGETLVLTGWQFSNLTEAAFGSDTKFWVYGQTNENDGVLVEATLQKLDGDIAAITLPDSLPERSSFMVWAENSTGYSKPVMINQTESWWIQETATRGQVASVFGRNLSQDGGTQVSQVYLEDSTGNGYWADVVEVNPYKVDFKVPNQLANGDYKVYVHNGDGGAYGWSKPLTMTVNDGLNYTGQVFNVKDFGAKGDGVTDDTAAIKAAFTAADKQPWATVYLPEGTYLVSSKLNPGNQVRWLGEGKDITTIKAIDGFTDSYLFQGSKNNQTTFQNLTLDANKANGSNIAVTTHLRFAADLQYLDIKINAEGASPFDWHGNNHVFMEDSDIIGKASYLGTAQQIFIDNTQFYGTDYSNMLLAGTGVEKLSITNSTVQNLDASDPNNGKSFKGRFFTDQPRNGIAQHQYFGNNQTIDLAPPPADFDNDGKIDIDRNSGEQIMWETGGTESIFLGSVIDSTSDSIAFEFPRELDDTWRITIISGKGMGQNRQIQSFSEATNTYEIDDEWNVLPDSTSVVVASKMVSKAVVYGNSFDGTTEAYQSPTHVASAGVQTFHGADDLIIDSNTFHELRWGIFLGSGGRKGFNPVYFTQVTDNFFEDDLIGVSFNRISKVHETNILGSQMSGNQLQNVDIAFEMAMNPMPIDDNSFTHANMNVYENNQASSVETFLSISQDNDNIHNNILINNDLGIL